MIAGHEQGAAFGRRHDQVERLVVVEVGRCREAAVVGRGSARAACDARRAAAAERGTDRVASGQKHAARRNAARAALLDRAGVKIQREPRKLAVAGGRFFLLGEVAVDQEVAGIALRAPGHAGRVALAVVLGGLAVVEAEFRALDRLAGDEVHDPRDGIGTVDGPRAFLQHLDTLDHSHRNLVHVDGTARGGRAANQTDAPTIEQNQRAFGVQTAQFDIGFAEAAAVVDLRVGRCAGDCRNALHQVADRLRTGLLNRGSVDHEHRAGGLGIETANSRSRDRDFFKPIGGGIRLVLCPGGLHRHEGRDRTGCNREADRFSDAG